MGTTETDLAVVGAGPGGYTAAIRGAQRGLDVVLIEKETVGGVCLNHGCIPAKSLIHAAGFRKDIQHWNEIGIHTGDLRVDFEAVQAWKDDVVRRLDEHILDVLDAHDVTFLEGAARFRDSATLAVESDDGTETVSFDSAVIATGSEPLELPGLSFDQNGVISSRDLLQIDTVPDEVVVVGGGYIGMEAVTKFAKFGAHVTVVEARDRVLGMFEPEVVDTIQETSEMYGNDIYTSAMATGVEYEDGNPVLVIDHDGTERRLPADYVVVAAGRDTTAHREALDLDTTDVELTDRGYIRTDERMRTTDDAIFCVGDAAGEPFLAHVAYRQGEVAAEVSAGGDASFGDEYVPTVMYTDPEVAVVGLTEREARDQYDSVRVGQVPMTSSGRALSANKPAGYAKVVADGDGRLRGVQVVSARAADMIAEATLALELDATLSDLSGTLHAHPTFPEALSEAAADANDESIHSL